MSFRINVNDYKTNRTSNKIYIEIFIQKELLKYSLFLLVNIKKLITSL